MGFDYRDAWIAVRSESTDDVLTALDSRSLRDCLWAEGAAQSLSTAPKTFFVSVPIDGEIWCAGQRFYDLIHDADSATLLADLGLTLDAPVRVPNRDDVERIASKTPTGMVVRERWIAPPLEGSSMPEPAPEPSLLAPPGLGTISAMTSIESAARGSAIARWVAEALVVFRAFRPSNTYSDPYRQSLPNAGSEPQIVIGVIVIFELAVFIANIIDKRQTAETQLRFRIRATRVLVAAAGVSLAGAALYVNDALLLMAGGFVALAGFIAASYIPDALFGGTKPVYDSTV